MWKVEKEQTSCVAVHPSLDHFAVGAVSGPVHIYSSKDWAVKATFQIASAEAVAPMKMAYVAVKDVKTTSWWLLVGMCVCTYVCEYDVYVCECNLVFIQCVYRGSKYAGLCLQPLDIQY